MKIPESLSLEQQFKLRTLQQQVHLLSLEDLQDCCGGTITAKHG